MENLRVAFGDFPRQVLMIEDEAFQKEFVDHLQKVGRRGLYDQSLSLVKKGPVIALLVLIGLVGVGYMWMLPWAAERGALLMPLSMDKKLGDVVFEGMSNTLDEDAARSQAMQNFGDHLDLSPRFDLTYHVVNDEQVNAFAMPGGHIVVFSGILDRMSSPEQLAALLAHEATHVEERHSTRIMMRDLASYAFLSLLVGDANAVLAILVENADAIHNMEFSRSLEQDADDAGMSRMHAKGVDPHGMVQLLQLLEEEAMDMPDAVSFLSSHPLTADRIENAEKKAAALAWDEQENEELFEMFLLLGKKELIWED